MTGEAAIYLEIRPARGDGGNREATLLFRSAAGGADHIGAKPAPGGDVRRRRLPVPPDAAVATWQSMKREAEQAITTVGPRSPQAPVVAVAAALAATGLDPRPLLDEASGTATDPAPRTEPPAPAGETHGEQGARVAAALTGAGPDPLEIALLKDPAALGEEEVRRVMQARLDLPPGDSRAAALHDVEKRYFEHAYGTEPAPRDDTGRTVEPTPRATASATGQPLPTPTGEPLPAALDRTVAPIAQAADRDGATAAVAAAQAGLNLLEAPGIPGRRLLDVPLKTDGDPGPKTRAALTRAVARLGAAKVNEAIALARLRHAADRAAGTADGPALAIVVRDALAPLFHSPLTPAARAVENEVLQETLNVLGVAPPLAVDGMIGAKTEAAFRAAARRHGADHLASALGGALGFGDV